MSSESAAEPVATSTFAPSEPRAAHPEVFRQEHKVHTGYHFAALRTLGIRFSADERGEVTLESFTKVSEFDYLAAVHAAAHGEIR